MTNCVSWQYQPWHHTEHETIAAQPLLQRKLQVLKKIETKMEKTNE